MGEGEKPWGDSGCAWRQGWRRDRGSSNFSNTLAAPPLHKTRARAGMALPFRRELGLIYSGFFSNFLFMRG